MHIPLRIWLFITGFVLLHFVLAQFHPTVVMWVVYALPIAVNLGLAAVFARTLLADRMPLITQFAYLSHPPKNTFSDEFEAYTYRQTVYWVVLTAGSAFALLSAIPLVNAVQWSLWGNLLVWGTQAAWFVLSHRYTKIHFGFDASALKSLRLISHPSCWRNTSMAPAEYRHAAARRSE